MYFIFLVILCDGNSANSEPQSKQTEINSEVLNSTTWYKNNKNHATLRPEFLYWQNGVPFNKAKEGTTEITCNGKTIFLAQSKNKTSKKITETNNHDKGNVFSENSTQNINLDTENNNISHQTENQLKFSYNKLNEYAGFKKGGACKMLACLTLSENMPQKSLPYDPFESKAFFDRYFKGTYHEVFQRFCSFNNYSPEDVLSHYRNQSKIDYRVQEKKKKNGTVDSMIAAFFKITK